jgi:hypothetical protein
MYSPFYFHKKKLIKLYDNLRIKSINFLTIFILYVYILHPLEIFTVSIYNLIVQLLLHYYLLLI